MSGFLTAAEPLARGAATAIANALWEDAAIFIAVALVLRAWPRLNASTRYAGWMLALVAAIAVPIFTALPRAQALPHHHRMPAFALPVAQHASPMRGPIAPTRSVSPDRGEPLAPPDREVRLPSGVTLGIAALWCAAALALCIRLLLALTRLQRLKSTALPLALEHRGAEQSALDSGGRDVRFCVSDETAVPVAVGLFDSMVLVPRHLFETLAPEEIEQICLHEMAHLRRADDWTNLFQRLVTALAWFSPAIYAIARGLDLEREVACDDDVIARTHAVRPYAHCLTKMAEITAWPHEALAAPGVFVTRRGISERIERLLRAGRNVARDLAFAPTALAVAVLAFLGFGMRLVAPTAAAPLIPASRAVLVAQAARPAATAPTTAAPAAQPREVRVPETHVHVPATHVHVPGVSVHVPAVDVSVPPIDVNVPGVDVHVPAIDVRVPAIDVPYASENLSGRDFSGRTFFGTDFSDARLERADFARARFTGVDFSDADLRGADFRGATLRFVDFSNARLRGAHFAGALLDGCDLSNADLSGVDLSRTRIVRANSYER